MRQILTISLILVFTISGEADNRYFMEQISLREGLSQTSVESVLRDATGLVWIGTRDGLNRYDGNEMNTYFHDPDDPTSLPSNHIYFVMEDENQDVWVGTSGGLAQYQPSINAFERINPFNTDTMPVYSHYYVRDQSLVFGSSDHLAIYDLKEQSFRILPFRGQTQALPFPFKMVPWKGSTVVIASRWQGLFICDLETAELRRASFCDEKGIMDAHMDIHDKLWVSIPTKGVMRFNKDGHLLAHYSEQNSGLSNNNVLEIQQVDDEIWLGSDGGGIDIFEEKTDSITKHQDFPQKRISSQLNSVTNIYEDRYGNLWVGTMRGGLLGMRQSNISSYSASPLNSNYGLSYPTVLNLYEDKTGTIWVGTDGEGINAYFPDKNTFHHYPATFGHKVNAVAPIRGSRMLLNYFGEGLVVFNRETGETSPFQPAGFKNAELPGLGTIGIDLFNHENRLVYILEEEIFVYDIDENRLKKLDTPELQYGEGGLMVAGKQGEDLFIYGLRNVYRLNLKSQKLSHVLGVENLPGEQIHSACLDPDGTIWTGTAQGLYAYTAVNGVRKCIESRLVRKVKSLIADKKGRIWFGAGGNLYSYYKEDDFFKAYGRSDGVVPNEYLSKPVLRAENGDVYLGGVTGLVRVGHEHTLSQNAEAHPHIISIREDGALIDKEKYEGFRKEKIVELPHDFRSFRVRVFVDDADFFNKNYIRYSIKGFSDQTIETSEMDIDLSGLTSGEYTLQISAKSSDGRWTVPKEMMHIKVLPPWWLTWWFISMAGVVLFFLLLLVRSLVYQRARNRMQVEMVQKENELNEQRVRFLVNISHELRTPLSLVYGPLEQILKGRVEQEEEKTKLMQTMFRHLKYIRELIDQLLDVRKMEHWEQELKMCYPDFNKWLQATINEFDGLFKEKNVDVEFDLDDRVSKVGFDPEKLKKVVFNILNNAFRYAPETRTIRVQSRLTEQNRVRVSVADEGPGVPDDQKEKIFDRYYMLNDKQGASGVGLAYSKMLIDLHGGSIGVENREPRGARFYFELPVQPNEEVVFEEHEQPGEEADSESDTSTAESSSEPDWPLFKDLVILVVEDDQELLAFLKSSLKTSFKRVLTARNGDDALSIIRSEYPDIVVSDVMMPVKDGWTLCKEIKTDLSVSHIPVVLLTAKNDEQDFLKGYKLGADQYLAKPVSFDLFYSVIENLLKNRMLLKKRYMESSEHFSPSELTYSNADEEFLSRLNHIIETEIENPALSVDFLVDKMAMSRAALYNKLKAIVGTSINNYINKYRVQYAESLLKNTDLSVADVSARVGFSGQAYFSTLFRQYTGYSPREYRKKDS